MRTTFHPNGIFNENNTSLRAVPTRNLGLRWRESFPVGNGAEIYLDVIDHGAGVAQSADVTFNPSRIAYFKPGTGNVHLAELPKVLGLVERLLARMGIPGVDFKLATLQRLDLARDFVLDEVSAAAVLDALYGIPRRNRPTVELHRSGPESETLYAGWKSTRRFKLYDQKAKHGTTFPTDLRFETEFTGHHFKAKQLKYVSDTERYGTRFVDLVTDAWSLSKFGATIVGPDMAISRLQASGLTGKDLGNVLGYLRLRELGLEHEYSRELRRKFERCLAEAHCDAIGDAFERAGHLDLELGRMVWEDEPSPSASPDPCTSSLCAGP